jgi:octaprenyl-diphosphate synthase
MAIQQLIKADVKEVNRIISSQLATTAEPIQYIGEQIIANSDKRLPVVIFLLSLRANGYRENHYLYLAVIIDFICTAIELHDRVVNTLESDPNIIDNRENSQNILVGDYLLSKAYKLMIKLGKFYIIERLSMAINRYMEGRALYLQQQQDTDISESIFMKIVENHSALLFRVPAQLGAIEREIGSPRELALANFGYHFGRAKQLGHGVLPNLQGYCTAKKPKPSPHHSIGNEIELAQAALNELPSSPYRSALHDLTLQIV